MSTDARATVHDESAVRKRIDVEFPADEEQRELDRGFERGRQQAHIRGSRPGKAPRKVVEQAYGEQIRREVISRLVEHSFHHAIEDHSLAVVGSPEIDAGALRLLAVLLRLAGLIMVTAFAAVLLPLEWMAITHRWIGLGEFPRAPIVEYLARSIAGLYGFHGVLLLIVSMDPLRYRTIVRYIAAMNVLFGLMLLAIDLHAGMPLFWTAAEGPSIAGFGLVVALLNRSVAGRPVDAGSVRG